MRACANCGQEVSDAATSCQNCGYPIGVMPAMYVGRMSDPAEPISSGALAGGEMVPWLRGVFSNVQVDGVAAPSGGQTADGGVPSTESRLLGGHLTVRPVAGRGSQVEDDERVLELTGQDIKIGRSPACEIALGADPLVSRRHAVMTCSGDGYSILDLGSSNGTLVNDMVIHTQTELHDGDRIAIGGYVIEVSAAPAGVIAPAIKTRATIPLSAFPLEDTDPHLAAIAGDAAGASELATATRAPERGEQQRAEPGSPVPDGSSSLALVAAVEAGEVTAGVGTSGHSRDLGALQDELTGMIQRLRQQAEEDARMAASLRQTLLEVQQRLEVLLGTQLEPASAGLALNVDKLAELARQTAQNPRHLDYILSLSERADDLAFVLEAVQRLQAGGGVVAALQALRTRVEQALA